MNRTSQVLIGVVVLSLTAVLAHAAVTDTWAVTGGGDWFAASNWNPAPHLVPTGTYTVTIANTTSSGTVTVNNGASAAASGVFTLGSAGNYANLEVDTDFNAGITSAVAFTMTGTSQITQYGGITAHFGDFIMGSAAGDTAAYLLTSGTLNTKGSSYASRICYNNNTTATLTIQPGGVFMWNNSAPDLLLCSGSYTGQTAGVTISGPTSVLAAGNLVVGGGANDPTNSALFTMNDGNVNPSGSIYVGKSSPGTMLVYGGTLTPTSGQSFTLGSTLGVTGTVIQSGGAVVMPGSSNQWVALGNYNGAVGVWTMSGGVLNVCNNSTGVTRGSLELGSVVGGTGYFTIGGNAVLKASGIYIGGNYLAAAGTGAFKIIGASSTVSILRQTGTVFYEAPGNTLSLRMDSSTLGISPITIGQGQGSATHNRVVFDSGAIIDPGFADGVTPYSGTWTIMSWTANTDIFNNGFVINAPGWSWSNSASYLTDKNFQLTFTAPEPGTIVLLAVGIVGMLCRRKCTARR
jgi:hypothetical protein